MYAVSAHGQALPATFRWSGNGGQAGSRDVWPGAREEEMEMIEARAGSSAEHNITRPHFLTPDPRQSELPLGLFDAKPDMFICISS